MLAMQEKEIKQWDIATETINLVLIICSVLFDLWCLPSAPDSVAALDPYKGRQSKPK